MFFDFGRLLELEDRLLTPDLVEETFPDFREEALLAADLRAGRLVFVATGGRERAPVLGETAFLPLAAPLFPLRPVDRPPLLATGALLLEEPPAAFVSAPALLRREAPAEFFRSSRTSAWTNWSFRIECQPRIPLFLAISASSLVVRDV